MLICQFESGDLRYISFSEPCLGVMLLMFGRDRNVCINLQFSYNCALRFLYPDNVTYTSTATLLKAWLPKTWYVQIPTCT